MSDLERDPVAFISSWLHQQWEPDRLNADVCCVIKTGTGYEFSFPDLPKRRFRVSVQEIPDEQAEREEDQKTRKEYEKAIEQVKNA